MKIEVEVAQYFDWKLRHRSEVKEGEVAIPSQHGPSIVMVREQVPEPSVTTILIPDSDLQRMEEDHKLGVENAAKGYTCIATGGPMDGQEVTVAPRLLPLKSLNQLVAEHLQQAVMPFHAHSQHIRKVKVVDGDMDPAELKKLERHLNRQMVLEDDEPAPVKRGKAAVEEEDK